MSHAQVQEPWATRRTPNLQTSVCVVTVDTGRFIAGRIDLSLSCSWRATLTVQGILSNSLALVDMVLRICSLVVYLVLSCAFLAHLQLPHCFSYFLGRLEW